MQQGLSFTYKWNETVFHATIYFTLNIPPRFTAIFMRLMTAGESDRWAKQKYG